MRRPRPIRRARSWHPIRRARAALRSVTDAERVLLFLAFLLIVSQIVLEVQTLQIQETNDDSHRIVVAATSGPAIEAQRAAFTDFLARQNRLEDRQIRIEAKLCGGPCPDTTTTTTPAG